MKLLVFDMGHVFVDFDWNEVCEGFCRVSGRSRDELKASMHHVSQLGYESGKVSTQNFLDELNKLLQTNLNLKEFSAIWVKTFCENQEMADLLSVLKQQRPLYLLSNTNEIHYEHLQREFNVARHFEELVLSYKVGSSKPEAEIYQEVLRRSGMPAEHCLFVDDLEANVQAAQKLGMQTILFRGVDKLKAQLKELGFRTES